MMVEKMKNLVVEEEGQGLSEYGLLLAGVVAAVVAAVLVLKPQLSALFTSLIDKTKVSG